MKKIISIIAICAATSSAYAAPQLVRRSSGDGYNVTYDYTDKAKSGGYITARAGLSLLNFKLKESVSGYNDSQTESYSFEPVFNGSLAIGGRLGYFTRGDIEVGYIGEFTDKGGEYSYDFSAPYIMANLYYDFLSGFYVGGGLGAALVMTSLDGTDFVDLNNRNERTIGFMGGINLGYAYKLDDNLVLDFRYRLAGIVSGNKNSREMELLDDPSDPTGPTSIHKVNVKNNFVMDNSISLGIRYEF